MTSEPDRSLGFWDREVVAPTHLSWMAVPRVRHYINERISGSPDLWPLDWLTTAFGPVEFRRALSVGCGAGALERDLLRRGICRTVDAFDGSVASLAIARRAARDAGLGGRLRYYAADFNHPVLPRHTYDAVFIHQALHHVRKLERLLRAVLRALEPGGMLYLDEYVGPSRDYWNGETVARYAAVYEALPPEMRHHHGYFPGPIEENDPSEAVRSGEILDQLAVGFETLAFRGYGGNLLAVLYPNLKARHVSEAAIEQLISYEQELLRNGESDFHAVIVARPKSGFSAATASARYFLEPKVKRIFRSLARRPGGFW